MRNVLLASVGVEKIIQRSFALERKVQGRGREKKGKGKRAREKELGKKGKRAREKGQ